MSHRHRKNDDAALGCVVYALLIVFFMPIVGLVLVCSKDPQKKPLGWVLLIVGLILWFAIGAGG